MDCKLLGIRLSAQAGLHLDVLCTQSGICQSTQFDRELGIVQSSLPTVRLLQIQQACELQTPSLVTACVEGEQLPATAIVLRIRACADPCMQLPGAKLGGDAFQPRALQVLQCESGVNQRGGPRCPGAPASSVSEPCR